MKAGFKFLDYALKGLEETSMSSSQDSQLAYDLKHQLYFAQTDDESKGTFLSPFAVSLSYLKQENKIPQE